MTYKSNKDMLKRQEFIMISEHHNIFRVADLDWDYVPIPT